jgi:small subunit ribosomal protein S13
MEKTVKKKDNKKFEKPVRVEVKSDSRKGIVRLCGVDVGGNTPVKFALMKVKGIGFSLGGAICHALKQFNIDEGTLVEALNEGQIETIEKVVASPASFGVKSFLLNRRGREGSLFGSELFINVRQDISREKEIKSYRGWRHMLNQKVRGQHTRSTGRSGMTVGVSKKALKPAQKKEEGKK